MTYTCERKHGTTLRPPSKWAPAMDERPAERLPLHQRLLRFLSPPRLYMTHDGPRYLAERISHQFEDELPTRKLKAVRL